MHIKHDKLSFTTETLFDECNRRVIDAEKDCIEIYDNKEYTKYTLKDDIELSNCIQKPTPLVHNGGKCPSYVNINYVNQFIRNKSSYEYYVLFQGIDYYEEERAERCVMSSTKPFIKITKHSNGPIKVRFYSMSSHPYIVEDEPKDTNPQLYRLFDNDVEIDLHQYYSSLGRYNGSLYMLLEPLLDMSNYEKVSNVGAFSYETGLFDIPGQRNMGSLITRTADMNYLLYRYDTMVGTSDAVQPNLLFYDNNGKIVKAPSGYGNAINNKDIVFKAHTPLTYYAKNEKYHKAPSYGTYRIYDETWVSNPDGVVISPMGGATNKYQVNMDIAPWAHTNMLVWTAPEDLRTKTGALPIRIWLIN